MTTDSRGFLHREITLLRANEMTPGELTIGALSKRTGVHIETIRYYERIAIMPEPARSKGGHRLYTSEHMKRLAFIARALRQSADGHLA